MEVVRYSEKWFHFLLISLFNIQIMSIDLQIIFSEIAHDHVISMVCTQIDDSSQPICPSETSLSV